MAKVIDRGSAKPDDPIYSTGPEMFSLQRFRPSTPTSPSATAVVSQAASSSAAEPLETEADGTRAGALRVARYQHQNKQLAEQAKAAKNP